MPTVRRLLTLCCLWLATIASPVAAQNRIALTFDDVPRGAGAFLSVEDRAARLIAALAAARVEQAAFFVNPGALAHVHGAGGEARIAAYVAAGHVVANHGNDHLALRRTDPAAYLADIDRAEAWLRPRAGHRPWFRFPFLDEGQADKAKRDAVREGLAVRGLSNGYVTAESSDWHIEALTIRATAAGKTIDRNALRDLYVESHVEAAEFADALMIRATGRQAAQVLLLHETDLAALFVGDLVGALRAKGWQIVTADVAYADPVAQEAARVDVPSAQGTLTEALAWARGLPAPRWYARNDTKLLDRLFAERVLHEGGER
jgi:peptidoglycan/xylan/chitin deacetylase (PgdA/CDA1 family)